MASFRLSFRGLYWAPILITGVTVALIILLIAAAPRRVLIGRSALCR